MNALIWQNSILQEILKQQVMLNLNLDYRVYVVGVVSWSWVFNSGLYDLILGRRYLILVSGHCVPGSRSWVKIPSFVSPSIKQWLQSVTGITKCDRNLIKKILQSQEKKKTLKCGNY